MHKLLGARPKIAMLGSIMILAAYGLFSNAFGVDWVMVGAGLVLAVVVLAVVACVAAIATSVLLINGRLTWLVSWYCGIPQHLIELENQSDFWFIHERGREVRQLRRVCRQDPLSVKTVFSTFAVSPHAQRKALGRRGIKRVNQATSPASNPSAEYAVSRLVTVPTCDLEPMDYLHHLEQFRFRFAVFQLNQLIDQSDRSHKHSLELRRDQPAVFDGQPLSDNFECSSLIDGIGGKYMSAQSARIDFDGQGIRYVLNPGC